MTVLAPHNSPGVAAGAGPVLPGGRDGGMAAYGVAAAFAPVPVPGTPPGTFSPGVAAAGAECDGGRIIRITRLPHAVPGKPDGEVDTRPLRPIWQHPAGPRSPATGSPAGEGR